MNNGVHIVVDHHHGGGDVVIGSHVGQALLVLALKDRMMTPGIAPLCYPVPGTLEAGGVSFCLPEETHLGAGRNIFLHTSRLGQWNLLQNTEELDM